MKIVVVGGGAAGFFGAIEAARCSGGQVTILETGRQVLTKVRISGGGRCNVTHACFEPAPFAANYPRGSRALRGAFSRFQAKDTVEWFQRQGILLKTEADGRMFPSTDHSETIVQGLLRAAEYSGVQVRLGTTVTSLARLDRVWRVGLATGEFLQADRVLLATGSSPKGYALAQQLGHRIEPPVPSLFTFNLQDDRLCNLEGVSVNPVQLSLQTSDGGKLQQTGPLLITHWGISGPAVLKLSAWGARSLHHDRYQASLTIGWLPQENEVTLQQQFQQAKSRFPRKAIANYCPVELPLRLWERLVIHCGIAETTRWAEMSRRSAQSLTQELLRGKYTVTGKGVFKEEFVTCGGIHLAEVDFKTMQSRLCPHLYFAGEILDIDGITGGFNFQNAWTTAWIAGQSMASG